MSSSAPLLVWFRNDLRLEDHPALFHAAQTGAPVVPVYLHTPRQRTKWARGGASNWWLHHALEDLHTQLAALGCPLILRSGADAETLLRDLLQETGAEHIYWNRRYEPDFVALDTQLKTRLPAKSFPGSVLREPGTLSTQSGNPYKVFTPYHRACLQLGAPSEPLAAPTSLRTCDQAIRSDSLSDWNLLPTIHWDQGMRQAWTPTIKGAEDHLHTFLAEAAGSYKAKRDYPGIAGTSRLSPWLHFGQISPRRIWHDCEAALQQQGNAEGLQAYTRQLVWRDFATQMLFHFPHTDTEPLQKKYAAFPWKTDPEGLRNWQQGQTGYPIVDAGMRELWATGWMHNRVRMIVASFLVKDLLISWTEGADWFWDTLVDADLANNSFGWQWAGGCGADAAPYFRIFNPILQSKKFDPKGGYIRKWVPELRNLTDQDIHAPWECAHPPKDYPPPMVDHKAARDRALEALSTITD